MTSTETRTTVVNEGMKLAVFETGNPDGPPIVLVHGWPDTHELWSHIVPLLAGRFRVISYDSRGAGESTVPQEQSAYRLANLASDFYAVIDAVPTNLYHTSGALCAHNVVGPRTADVVAQCLPTLVALVEVYAPASEPLLLGGR